MALRVLLVGNPSSQSGRNAERIATTAAAMVRRGWEVSRVDTLPERAALPRITAAADPDRVDVVVALGGDGTFSEVATAILGARRSPPLAMLPAGTANDQAKSFGLAVGAEALEWNLDVIEARHVRRLDVGHLERLDEDGVPDAMTYVFHSAGWGFQPDVLAQRNQDRELVGHFPLLRELYRDQAVYAGAILQRYLASWVEPTKFDAEALLDGERVALEQVTDVIVNATPVYGGAWVLDPDAEYDDGRFEFIPVHGRRDWAVAAVAHLKPVVTLSEQLGIPVADRASRRSFRELLLTMHRDGKAEIRSQIDGEEWLPGRRFRLTVHPRVLPILVPAEFEPTWKQPLQLPEVV